MFIELVDVFRCTAAHEETWLVATADRMIGRHIDAGSLGCPICRASWPIRDGAADFSGGGPVRPVSDDDVARRDPTEEAMRLAALLGLTEPGQRVLLFGGWARLAAPLLAVVAVELLLVDAPPDVGAGDGRSPLRCGAQPVPLAAGSMRGAALDLATAGDPLRADAAVRAVRAGGRVVGPVAASVPADVRELARDERHWVGERTAPASAPVPLQIVRGRSVRP